jgi:hypothetical protein
VTDRGARAFSPCLQNGGDKEAFMYIGGGVIALILIIILLVYLL